MVEPGQKDRDDAAHRAREQLNLAAEASLEDWVRSILSLRPGQRVLDLGCGTGKLTFACASAVLPGGSVLGVDIAADSIAELTARASQESLQHVRGRVGNLDTILDELAGRRFDRIVSSYALYYATDMMALLIGLRKLLADDGEVFVCGPGEGTNREMTSLVRSLSSNPDACPQPLEDFISAEQIETLEAAYATATSRRLGNIVSFPDADRLLGWWRNHSSHVPEADTRVAGALQSYFKTHDAFRLTKNVLGVHLRA